MSTPKPITHPLAIEIMERMSKKQDIGELFPEWRCIGSPLYADPTPLPAPALGMRVWWEEADGYKRLTGSQDVTYLTRPDETWSPRLSMPHTIVLITDFRTGEVLWRKA